MVGAKIYGAFSTITSIPLIGAVAASQVHVHHGAEPTDIPFVGPVPLFAVSVGVLTAFLVRWVTMTTNKGKLWGYNLAITTLAMLGAAVFIIDNQVGPGNSFWVGGSFGATGAGMIGVMKSPLFRAIVEGVRGGFFKGLSMPPAPPAGPDVPPKSE